MGVKRKKIKKHGKRFKKKKKKKRKRRHENDFTEIEVEDVVHQRKIRTPLYDRYKRLFAPGEQSFWDRWLIKTPPVPMKDGRDQKLFSQVDTIGFLPTEDMLDVQYKEAYKRIQHEQEDRAEKHGWGRVRKKLIKDKKKEKAAKLPKIASATQLENQDVIFDKKKKKKKAMSYFGDHSDSEEEAVPLQYPAVNISSKHIDKHVHEIILCQECESVQCTLTCLQCEQNYCEKCLLKLHSKSRKLVNHFWVPYRRVKSSGTRSSSMSNLTDNNKWETSLRS